MTDRMPDDPVGDPLSPAGLTAFVLDLNGAEETYPFGPEARVFKVAGKVFAIDNTPVHRSLAEPTVSVTVKALPENVPRLIRSVPGIDPGYHMSKKHWVTVDLSLELPEGLLEELIEDSYDLIVDRLPARDRP